MKNNKNPLVSILLLVYNHEKWIIECIASIFRQSYKKYELILLNDNSSDSSHSHIKELIKYSKDHSISCQYICNNRNTGSVPKNLNTMLGLARGEYIIPFAGDDIMRLDRIEKQVNIMEENQKISMLHADVEYIDIDSNLIGYKWSQKQWITKANKMNESPLSCLLHKNFVAAASIIIRKKELIRLGGWNENLFLEDYPMSLALAANGKIKYMNEVVSYYRKTDTNLTATMGSKFSNMKLMAIESHITKYGIQEKDYRSWILLLKKMIINDTDGISELKNKVFPLMLKIDLSLSSIAIYIYLKRCKNNYTKKYIKIINNIEKVLKISTQHKIQKLYL